MRVGGKIFFLLGKASFSVRPFNNFIQVDLGRNSLEWTCRCLLSQRQLKVQEKAVKLISPFD